MKNWAEPTPDELHDWAYDEQSSPPVQDWELFLSRTLEGKRATQVFDLIQDQACPKRQFLLDVVDLTVKYAIPQIKAGDVAAERYINALLVIAQQFTDPYIKQWRYHTRRVVQQPACSCPEKWSQMMIRQNSANRVAGRVAQPHTT